jgi:hypothetical protein
MDMQVVVVLSALTTRAGNAHRGTSMITGLVLIAIGIIYLVKPTLFRRGIWLKTSIAIRVLSEENYVRYMRILGVVLIVGGLVIAIGAIVSP